MPESVAKYGAKELKMLKKAFFLLGALIMLVSGAYADLVPVNQDYWTGSRSTAGVDQLYATGTWGDAGNGSMISWNISYNAETKLYHYSYTISGADGGALSSNMSHWMLQLSAGAVMGDFSNMDPYSNTGIATWLASNPGNPSMGGDIYGLKWSQTTDFTATGYPNADSIIYTFSFDTERQPVWGDFYARCGQSPGEGVFNTTQNLGLYSNVEPTLTTTDFTFWIPVVDSKTQPVPLPPSTLLLGSGLLGLVGWRRFRKS
jgi:hypothetical protein